MRPFEIALIGFFSIAGLVGLFFLGNYKPGATAEDQLFGKSVVIWGTFDEKPMQKYLLELTRSNKAVGVVKYTQIDPRSFENEFVNALAEGRAPDLVMIPHTQLVLYQTKLQPISFDTIPMRTFRDTYIDGAEIFMRSDGIYGIPFAADPLVMYWNRDLFSTAGIAQPPATWETLTSQTVTALVRKDDSLNISQSALAFGEYSNITHAKDILAMLFLQAGTNIVEEKAGTYEVVLAKNTTSSIPPGEAALTFYTQFSSPSSSLYSWNRSQKMDRDAFIGETLAMYFGKGSEKTAIERENANLNFDIAVVPQESGATVQRNYADFYAFAIPRTSHNLTGAYAVAQYLSSPDRVGMFLDTYNLAPVHRALHTGNNADPLTNNIYKSALIARGWLDPSPKESGDVFRVMIEEVAVGRTRVSSIILDAVHELEALF
jgi:ABC-type glycerol-3-phosphate transport system substrate-binding protein